MEDLSIAKFVQFFQRFVIIVLISQFSPFPTNFARNINCAGV